MSLTIPTLTHNFGKSQAQSSTELKMDDIGPLLHELEPTPIASNNIKVVDRFSFIHKDMLSASEDYLYVLNHTERLPKDLESIPVGNLYDASHIHCSLTSNQIPDTICSQVPGKRMFSLELAIQESTRTTGNTMHIHKYQQDGWMERYKRLVQFYTKHGHCNVSYGFDEDSCLGQWVKRQRHQYKRKVLGKRSNLTDDRIALLESLGFIWDSHEIAWEQNYEQLRQFHTINKHCKVPAEYKKGRLSNWLKKQRMQCRRFVEKKPSTMSQYRLAKLAGLGFGFCYRFDER
jgi:hypothetical protein